MTAANFNSAVDLSGLKAAAQQPQGASYVVEANDQTFQEMLGRSMQHPIVVEFYSPRAMAQALSKDLKDLANEAAGKYLLVRVNIDTSPAIAQALGIQAVPMVVGVLGGQMGALFQGTTDKASAKAAIDELLRVAVGNGMVARAQPVAQTVAGDENVETADPRFAAADAALATGDYATALAEFNKLLAANPNDVDAQSGKAGAELFMRLDGLDPQTVLSQAQAAPKDVDAQCAAADLELASGRPELAFDRLLTFVRLSAGDDRDQARIRLIELFSIVGNSDPLVLKARRDLMSALF